jgi:Domain of unknown function (DUF4386)
VRQLLLSAPFIEVISQHTSVGAPAPTAATARTRTVIVLGELATGGAATGRAARNRIGVERGWIRGRSRVAFFLVCIAIGIGSGKINVVRHATAGADMSSSRRTALIAGLWFAGTFVFSIPALFFYDPVLNDADYILGAGADTRTEFGAFLEILLAICNIATAVVLFPILRRVDLARWDWSS